MMNDELKDCRLLFLIHRSAFIIHHFSYCFLEHPPALLEVVEHIEARARGREQDYVARVRKRRCTTDSIVHVGRACCWGISLQFLLDSVCVLADEDERTHVSLDERRERRVWRVLAAPAENQDDLAGRV